MSRSDLDDLALLVVPGAIWGASFLFIAEGLDAMAPLGVTFVRLFIGFLTLSVVPAARRPLAPGDGWPMAGLSIIWLAFPLTHVPVRRAAGVVGARRDAERLDRDHRRHRRRPAGPAVAGAGGAHRPGWSASAGIVLMAIPSIDGASSAAGIAMVVAAVTSYGVSINLARPLQMRSGALPVVWRTLGVATLVTAPLGLPAVLDAEWTTRSLLSMLALGAFGTAIANVIMTVATGRLGATRASATVFLIPVVALVLGVMIRGEHVAPLSIVGAAVCLAGAWLIRPRPAIVRATPAAATPACLEPAGR